MIKQIFILFALVLTMNAHAFTITTWNLEHMMSKERFDIWSVLKNDEKCELNRPIDITYCDALDGKEWTAESCDAQLTKGVENWADFKNKIAQIKTRVLELESDIFAIQEFSDISALRLVFDESKYQLFSSTASNTPQNVGYAVKRKVFKKVTFNSFNDLALDVCKIASVAERRQCKDHWTRPGVELNITTQDGDQIAILNVHLKSGCRFFPLNMPYDSIKASSKHSCEPLNKRKERIFTGCRGLGVQADIINNWVDSHADDNFILVGDFNRSYWAEFTNTSNKKGKKKWDKPESFLLQASDNIPAGATVEVILQNLKTSSFGLFDSCHKDIDWFAIGRKLADELGWDRKSKPRSVGKDFSPYRKDMVKPSDHCPITLDIPLS